MPELAVEKSGSNLMNLFRKYLDNSLRVSITEGHTNCNGSRREHVDLVTFVGA